MNKVALLSIKWIRLSLCLITLSFFVLSCEKDEIESVENQDFIHVPTLVHQSDQQFLHEYLGYGKGNQPERTEW